MSMKIHKPCVKMSNKRTIAEALSQSNITNLELFKTQGKRNSHGEDNMTIQVMNYLRGVYPEVLAFHVPNERKIPKLSGFYMNKMGRLSGVPDILICRQKPNIFGGRHKIHPGCFIELKYGKNTCTPNQTAVQDKFLQEGWFGAVCYSYEEAVKCIDRFLSL